MQDTGVPPFGRGRTFFDGRTPNLTEGLELLGKEFWFPDMMWNANGVATLRSQEWVKCKIVRNQIGTAGVALPKRIVRLASESTAAGGTGAGAAGPGKQAVVVSYAHDVVAATMNKGYLTDEFLPAGGAVYNDLFYIVTRGHAMGMSALTTMTAINVGDFLTNLTATTAQGTDGSTASGKLNALAAVSLTPELNFIGRALSAATSEQYSADILVDVGAWV